MARSVLVITGAAATGKTTVGGALREDPSLLVIDGDVMGQGAAAVAGTERDYVAFWRHLLAVAQEVRANGLVPVYPCICLPEQVIAAATDETIHFLALISDSAEIRTRLHERDPANSRPSVQKHSDFNAQLRMCTVPPPHTIAFHDVSANEIQTSVAKAHRWARQAIKS